MTINLMTFKTILIGAVMGSFITTFFFFSFFHTPGKPKNSESIKKEREPLYWVAPMDPNYKRDKPGKSPMGMDLVPVYKNDNQAIDTGPGTIKISPEVVNNLGVRTAIAARQKLNPEIKTVGYVKYNEEKLVHIHPRVSGWIEKLHVKAAGDPVTKGQPLYDIYSPELVNAQEEYLLALDRKNPRLQIAAEERLKALRFSEDAVKALQKTKKIKQAITLYAPQNGVLDNLTIREGFFVKPGTTLMSIGSLEQVWVEAEIFERQASYVKEGLPVTMSLDYSPGKEWRGIVDYIYPTLDPKNRTVRVRLRFNNENKELKPNMFSHVNISVELSDESLLVPKEAVIRTGNFDRLVLALGDGQFKSVQVKVGRMDNQSAEILSGIEAGDKIVSSAHFLLDSESSKTSDFKRMALNHDEESRTSQHPKSVWVEATINDLMEDHRMINATHEAIEVWQWPEMTMDFMVDKQVNFSDLKPGMTVHLEITKNTEDQYLVTNIHIPSTPNSEKDKKTDHEKMDHSTHQKMNHDTMDHSHHKQ